MIDEIIDQINNFESKELYELQQYDLQYIAIKNLYKNIQDKEIFLKIITINSLLTYQLSSTWEKYWLNFSEYFSKIKIDNLKDSFTNFLSLYNKRLLKNRIKRLDKILIFIENISLKQLLIYWKNQEKLLYDLSYNLKQKQDAKTIVFCMKIFIWWNNIIWIETKYNPIIFIPLDNRLSKISQHKTFWLEMKTKSKHPLLLLDSLFFMILWNQIENIKNKNIRKKVLNLQNKINNYNS